MGPDKPIGNVTETIIDEFDINLNLPETIIVRGCPKCHSLAKTKAAPGPNKKRWSVWCSDSHCKAHLKFRFLTEEEAIFHWNAIKRR